MFRACAGWASLENILPELKTVLPNADFVIEGYVDPTEPLRDEGPFGDHTGYYTLPEPYPVFHPATAGASRTASRVLISASRRNLSCELNDVSGETPDTAGGTNP